MRQFLVILLFAFISGNAGASGSGQYDVSFTEEKRFALSIDYSFMKIDDMEVEDWLYYRQMEQPEYDSEHELEKELKPAVLRELFFNINDSSF